MEYVIYSNYTGKKRFNTIAGEKFLKKVGYKTLLEYGVERIQKAQKIKEIIIATTVNEKDDVDCADCTS